MAFRDGRTAIQTHLDTYPDASAHLMIGTNDKSLGQRPDYLERTGFRGNVMTFFRYDAYLSWRLYPNVKSPAMHVMRWSIRHAM